MTDPSKFYPPTIFIITDLLCKAAGQTANVVAIKIFGQQSAKIFYHQILPYTVII